MWRDTGTSQWNDEVALLEACWLTGGTHIDPELVAATKEDMAACGAIIMANRDNFRTHRPK